jgi:glyoxylase-like metal-dependent hydrolase (beta-lactamase superfamily II)
MEHHLMIFRQLFDPVSSTYTYILGDEASREAIIIDPVFDQVHRDIALLRELGLRLVASLDTHVHADHVTGAWLLREHLGSRIALAAKGGAAGVDLPLAPGDRVVFGARNVEARATPGHTDGCMTYVLDDLSMAFTGDALLSSVAAAERTSSREAQRAFSTRCARRSSASPTAARSGPAMITPATLRHRWARRSAIIHASAAT